MTENDLTRLQDAIYILARILEANGAVPEFTSLRILDIVQNKK